jgi:hypothetical protein
MISSRKVQHFTVLRFLPMVPRFWTLRMYSAASGTLHDVLPMFTLTTPISSAVRIAWSVSAFT